MTHTMNHPNFFILGAQKAGTTWLAAHLAEHPDVFFTDPKEPLFFSRKRGLTAEDYAAYRTRFFGAAGDQIWRGEGSTTYLQWPLALDRIQTFVPGQPRFIICLRQPLAKAISFFVHNWRRGRYPAHARLTFGRNRGTLSPLGTSLYADSIARWLAAYPRENFLFLRYEDLGSDPAAFLGAATDFLGIPPMTMHRDEKINAGLPLVWEDNILTTRTATGPWGHARFPLEDLLRVQEKLLPDIRQTAALTGLDLSGWLRFPDDLAAPGSARGPDIPASVPVPVTGAQRKTVR
jgi:hypothetical protein